MINICVPVLKRYDLLRQLALSLQKSNVKPSKLCIIDNGRDAEQLRVALEDTIDRSAIVLDVLTPERRLGVAESWNWFIKNTREERIISNDDIVFAPDSIEKMVASQCELVWASGFSCFLLRDSCVAKLGLFDETISPGYGYYEDDDYLQRLDGRGTRERSATAENVECGVIHHNSGTLKAASHKEILEHHRLFKIAQGNYVRKWGLEATFR